MERKPSPRIDPSQSLFRISGLYSSTTKARLFGAGVLVALAAMTWGCPSHQTEMPRGDEKTATSKTNEELRDSPSEHSDDSAASRPGAAPAPGAASQPGPSSMNGASPEDRDQVDPDGVVRRGVHLSEAAPITVDECEAKAADLENKTVKVSGPIASVCKAKGCWMVLQGNDGHKIRITAKDYSFFVPKNAVGWVATVEGQLEVKTLDVETAQHLENESGSAPKTITEPTKELTITAAGLILEKPKAS